VPPDGDAIKEVCTTRLSEEACGKSLLRIHLKTTNAEKGDNVLRACRGEDNIIPKTRNEWRFHPKFTASRDQGMEYQSFKLKGETITHRGKLL